MSKTHSRGSSTWPRPRGGTAGVSSPVQRFQRDGHWLRGQPGLVALPVLHWGGGGPAPAGPRLSEGGLLSSPRGVRLVESKLCEQRRHRPGPGSPPRRRLPAPQLLLSQSSVRTDGTPVTHSHAGHRPWSLAEPGRASAAGPSRPLRLWASREGGPVRPAHVGGARTGRGRSRAGKGTGFLPWLRGLTVQEALGSVSPVGNPSPAPGNRPCALKPSRARPALARSLSPQKRDPTRSSQQCSTSSRVSARFWGGAPGCPHSHGGNGGRGGGGQVTDPP